MTEWKGIRRWIRRIEGAGGEEVEKWRKIVKEEEVIVLERKVMVKAGIRERKEGLGGKPSERIEGDRKGGR